LKNSEFADVSSIYLEEMENLWSSFISILIAVDQESHCEYQHNIFPEFAAVRDVCSSLEIVHS
jgi:hypothetical protein